MTENYENFEKFVIKLDQQGLKNALESTKNEQYRSIIQKRLKELNKKLIIIENLDEIDELLFFRDKISKDDYLYNVYNERIEQLITEQIKDNIDDLLKVRNKFNKNDKIYDIINKRIEKKILQIIEQNKDNYIIEINKLNEKYGSDEFINSLLSSIHYDYIHVVDIPEEELKPKEINIDELSKFKKQNDNIVKRINEIESMLNNYKTSKTLHLYIKFIKEYSDLLIELNKLCYNLESYDEKDENMFQEYKKLYYNEIKLNFINLSDIFLRIINNEILFLKHPSTLITLITSSKIKFHYDIYIIKR